MLKLLPIIIFAACATAKAGVALKKKVVTEQGVEIRTENNQKIITNK
jgi:hypothetical protein